MVKMQEMVDFLVEVWDEEGLYDQKLVKYSHIMVVEQNLWCRMKGDEAKLIDYSDFYYKKRLNDTIMLDYLVLDQINKIH